MSQPNEILKRAEAKAKREKWENLFEQQLRAEVRTKPWLAGWEREWRFDARRKWRFDYFWPAREILETAVAVELEGLTAPWMKSRHTTNAGYSEDLRKCNRAAELEIFVYRFTGEMVKSGEAIRTIEHVLKQRTD